MAKKVEFVVVRDGASLARKIGTCINGLLNKQDEVHVLAVSGMYHYWLHGDSTYLTLLTSGITKCNGVNKSKLIGFITEICGLNWDTNNLRFKKAKDSKFTKASGVVEFPEGTLMAKRWYEFALDDSEIPSWMVDKVFAKVQKDLETNESDAREQLTNTKTWAAWTSLSDTVHQYGLRSSEIEVYPELSEAA